MSTNTMTTSSSIPLVPHCFTSVADIFSHLRQNERTLILWDADDTLVATAPGTGPRGRLLEDTEVLNRVFSPTDAESGQRANVEHKILSAGSVDDLFLDVVEGGGAGQRRPLLLEWSRAFGETCSDDAAPPDPPRIIYVPALKRHVILPRSLLGVSTRAPFDAVVRPTTRSVSVDGVSKLDFALACATSGHWDHVVLVDNQMMEVGCLQPGHSEQQYLSSPHHDDASEIFSVDFARVHATLLQSGAPCRLSVAHIRTSSQHKVLPGERPVEKDEHYFALLDRFQQFNTMLLPRIDAYFEGRDVAAEVQMRPVCSSEYPASCRRVAALLADLRDGLMLRGDGDTATGRTHLKSVAKEAMRTIETMSVVDPAHNVARRAAFAVVHATGGVPMDDGVKSEVERSWRWWQDWMGSKHYHKTPAKEM